MHKLTRLFLAFFFLSNALFAQEDSTMLLLLNEEAPQREYVKNAFKSNRVINGHSMEMTGKGVLDFRILHRFGMLKGGLKDMFGLDQASMRLGLDYGIHKNLTIGIGRSTYLKEFDGYVKYRLAHQRKGKEAFPVSIIWVSGATLYTIAAPDPRIDYFSNRLGYYHQLIVGRKMSENLTLQVTPTLVHRNMVNLASDKNDMLALGLGARIKITNRSALIFDTYPILYGASKNVQYFPLSIGMDIETGGHVFQLHITNARGMNERAFIADTYQTWGKGEIQFGFNLSRVFTVTKNTETSW
ncbi:MAG: DUF5777 family beta-barrel protein [Chitinophagaceae bacterium]